MSAGHAAALHPSEMSPQALRVEQRLLTDFAQQLAAQPNGDVEQWRAFAGWLSGLSLGDASSVRAEAILERATERLRAGILRSAHAVTEKAFRSPDSQRVVRLPSGRALDHSYERNMDVVELEHRLRLGTGSRRAEGWDQETVAFNSGMAALNHAIQSLIHMLAPSEARPLNIAFWGDYFETELLLKYLSSSAVSVTLLPAHSIISATLAHQAEILFIEPVRYNRELDVLPLLDWLRAWRSAGPARRIVIFDTTLSSPVWPMREVLRALTAEDAVMVLEVRSALKLDQLGLELANLGVIDVFHHPGHHPAHVGGVPTATQLADTLRLARGVTGAGPRASDVAALDVPFLFDHSATAEHAASVYANNQRVAERLASIRGVFSRAVHPALAAGDSLAALSDLRQAPFVVIELAEDTVENHGFVLAVLRHEAQRHGIRLTHGASFGFRSHRFDAVIPRVADPHGFLKFAAGARSGPFLDTAIQILSEIGGTPDMTVLRSRYGKLKGIPLLP